MRYNIATVNVKINSILLLCKKENQIVIPLKNNGNNPFIIKHKK